MSLHPILNKKAPVHKNRRVVIGGRCLICSRPRLVRGGWALCPNCERKTIDKKLRALESEVKYDR